MNSVGGATKVPEVCTVKVLPTCAVTVIVSPSIDVVLPTCKMWSYPNGISAIAWRWRRSALMHGLPLSKALAATLRLEKPSL